LNCSTRRRSCDRFDNATHAGSLSLCALQTPSVVGLRVPLPCGHGVVPHSPRLVAQYAPLIPAPVSALDFRSRSRTRPPSFFSFGAPLLARLLANRTPSPPFFFFPTQARTGSAPWPMPSPPCDLSLVISLYAASTPAHCTTTSVHQAFIMPPCLPLLHSTPRSEVELVESIPSVRAWVGEAREAVRKKVVGGRAT
jgi:hypothetical protein